MPPGIEICFNDSEDTFPLPAAIRAAYGPFGFPPPPKDRPYICANFVQGLDGLVSFRDLPGQTGGEVVARSRVDQWLARMIRAHQDAILLGAATLRAEPGPDGRGFDYTWLPPPWRAYRRRLGMAPPRAVVMTRAGRLNPRHRLFAASGPPPRSEVIVATTAAGALRLRPMGLRAEIIVPNAGDRVRPLALARLLRRDWGIERLLCEAGPEVYAQWLAADLVDEDFRTIALQVMGQAPGGGSGGSGTRGAHRDPQRAVARVGGGAALGPAPMNVRRPTAYGALSFLPATAPWYRMISLHVARPSHLFLRLRRRPAPAKTGTMT